MKLKFSAFLSCVEVTKCVNFQIPRLIGLKVGIFRISPIIINLKTILKMENIAFANIDLESGRLDKQMLKVSYLRKPIRDIVFSVRMI